MQTSRGLRSIGAGAIAAAIVVAGATAPTPTAAQTQTLKLFNGPPQGGWRPIADQLKKIIEAATKDNVVIEPGGGLSNVIALQTGKGELGMVVSTAMVTGLRGEAPFKQKLDNVLALATLYYQLTYIMTFDPKIDKLADLKGKRVSVMPKGYAAEAVNQLIMKTVGVPYGQIREQFLGEVESGDGLRDNHLDAVMAMGDTSYGIAIDLASTGKLRFVSVAPGTIAELQKINGGLYPYTIKAGKYPGQKTDVTTVSATVVVTARSDFSADKAKAITKGMVDALPELQKSFNAFKDVTKADMAKDFGLPFHPGAMAYFREAGLAK